MPRSAALLLTSVFVLVLPLPVALKADDFPTPHNSERDTAAKLTSPEEALKLITVPEGFRATLFASEPEVQNPVAMAWDERGRLWVAENYTYAERELRFDMTLRDRILVFEDKDWDGKADSRKVFIDKLQVLTSVETGRGGVWALCPPQLLFIPDADGDAVPDGAPEVVLDGFTVADANYHNFANGLRWGPDGWLYGRCGHSCPALLGTPGTPADRRVPMQGGIWRFHPEKKVVEVLTHGTTNPWGHDWDRNGELFFINTVTGHLWHLMPGAHLHDTRPSPNPNVFHRLDTIADHYHFDTKGSWQDSRDGKANDLGGGHAHIGMMICLSETWPEKYRDKLFTLNMHGRRANVERLERLGCGYVGRHEPDFFLSGDPWFRGIEISQGPDGNAWVLDWSDTGECHDHTGVHRTSGRIFRIAHEGQPQAAARPVVKPWCAAGDGPLPTLWRDHREGRLSAAQLRERLGDPDEHVRVWAIRLLTDFWPIDTIVGPLKGATYPEDAESVARFVRMAREDASGLVRLALASTLQRLPSARRVELASALVSREEDASDAHLPALVWHGLMPVAESQPEALLTIARDCALPDTLRWMTRSLAARAEKQPALLNGMLALAKAPWQRQAVLQGMSDGFSGWRKAPKPEGWDAWVAKVPPGDLVRELSVLFGDGRALDDVKRLALDKKADLPQRQAALQTLIENRPPDLREICEAVLGTNRLTALAARGLSTLDAPAIGERLAKDYLRYSPEDRPAVLEVLVSRPAWAKALLSRIGTGKGQIPPTELPAFQARQILALKDEALAKHLAEVWGELRESASDKRAVIEKLAAELTPERLAGADLSQGRLLYQSVCGACHILYGEGGKIGPDLTGSGRADLGYLLDNIVDPGAVVTADYRMSILTLADGRVVTGVVAAENDRTLTLRQAIGELTVEKGEIAKREVSPVSMMPEGLLLVFQPDQIRDLIAYLKHPVQVPLPGQ